MKIQGNYQSNYNKKVEKVNKIERLSNNSKKFNKEKNLNKKKKEGKIQDSSFSEILGIKFNKRV